MGHKKGQQPVLKDPKFFMCHQMAHAKGIIVTSRDVHLLPSALEPPPSEEVSGFQEQTASPVAMVSSSELPQEGQSLLCGHLIQLHHCTLHLSENDFL